MNDRLHKVKRIFVGSELGWLYIAVLLLLLVGVVNFSGTQYLGYMGIVLVTFLVTYILLHTAGSRLFLRTNMRVSLPVVWRERLIYALIFFLLVTSLVHLFWLEHLPLLRQWQQTDAIVAAKVRRAVTAEIPSPLKYAMAFSIRAILPFLLVFLFHTKRKKLFWMVAAVGLFYSLNLLQKSFVVFYFLPLIIYFASYRKWGKVLLSGGAMVLLVFLLFFVSNPALRGHEQDTRVTASDAMERSSRGLLARTVFMPGRIVTVWFDHIPSEYPFLKGCGYNFAAPLIGCEFVNYSAEMYKAEYPQYAAQGLEGSANGASFVYDYANFGVPGLALGGILAGFFIWIAGAAYNGRRRFMFAMNAGPVLMLSSTSLTTLLLSGGWGLIMVFGVLFKDDLK